MHARALLFVTLAVAATLVAACAREHATTSATADPTPSAKASAARPDAAAPKGDVTDPCAELRERFSKALGAAPMTCKVAADCVCYAPVPADSCGGVVDAETGRALAKIEAEFHAAKCPWVLDCKPWECAPKCAAGHCLR